MTRVVLLAGPSGSGKSRVAGLVGAVSLRLDDFYFDADHPGLPRTLGIVDWDDPATWDCAAAVAALDSLVRTGSAEVPLYSISESRRVGTHTLTVGPDGVVIAEGIFAVRLLQPALAAGLLVEPLYLDRNRTLVAALRLRRDLAEHRKSPWVLLRRGVALWRAQPAFKADAAAAGFAPVSMRRAVGTLG